MPLDKIAIMLDRELVKEIDRGVKSGLYLSRSRAIEEALRGKFNRNRRRRLSVEAKKLDRKEERALAEAGMSELRHGLAESPDLGGPTFLDLITSSRPTPFVLVRRRDRWGG